MNSEFPQERILEQETRQNIIRLIEQLLQQQSELRDSESSQELRELKFLQESEDKFIKFLTSIISNNENAKNILISTIEEIFDSTILSFIRNANANVGLFYKKNGVIINYI